MNSCQIRSVSCACHRITSIVNSLIAVLGWCQVYDPKLRPTGLQPGPLQIFRGLQPQHFSALLLQPTPCGRFAKVTTENSSFAYSLSVDSRFSSVRFLRIVLICNPQALKRDFGPGAAPMRCLMTFEIKIQRSAVLPLELAHRFAHQSWECKDVAFRCCFACLR